MKLQILRQVVRNQNSGPMLACTDKEEYGSNT